MGSVGIGITGAVAILLAAAGVLVPAMRPGPHDLALAPAVVPAQADGTYHARAAGSGPLCAVDPDACAGGTDIDLRLRGLPDVPVAARLEGPAGATELGDLARTHGGHLLSVDSEEDHADKTRLVLLVAGWPVHAFPVAPSQQPRSLDGGFAASFQLGPVGVRIAHSGAVEVSTVASGEAPFRVPHGWVLVAALVRADGATRELGTFEAEGEGSTLDARVERVRFGPGDAVLVALRPEASASSSGPGFPVAQGRVP